MGKSLYRSYRSRTFDEIVGQDHIITVLKNSLKSESINHAYLLSGPRGVGKTSTARILAYTVNGIKYEGENIHLDIIEIDAASNRRIDEVREIRDKVHIAPTSGKYKVYIIDEVHMLTKEAFNALLKTLEEPPAHVIFILATTESHKVPETILSRCIKLNFKPISLTDQVNHLAKIAKKEGLQVDKEALELISKHAMGSFRDSISLLEQLSTFNRDISVELVSETLGLAPAGIVEQLIAQVKLGAINQIHTILEQTYEKGTNELMLTTQVSEALRNMLMSADEQTIETHELIKALEELLDVPGSPDPRLKLELILVKLCLTNQQPLSAPQKAGKSLVKVQSPQKSTKVVLSEDTSNIWDKLLVELKNKNSTLYGIARMAEVNQTGKKLELAFKFKFHQQQFNQVKNQEIIKECLEKLNASDYSVNTTLISPENNPIDLQNVSNIFGAHEVIES